MTVNHQAKGKSWEVPKNIASEINSSFEKIFLQEDEFHIKNYCCLPIFQSLRKNHTQENWEPIPFGLLLLRNTQFDEKTFFRLKRFCQFCSEIISQKNKVKNLEKEKNDLTSSLSFTRQNLLRTQGTIQKTYNLESIVGGKSKPMMRVLKMLNQIIPSLEPIVILGESGTGKELFARAIHYNGPLKDGPLVVINCGSLHEGILGSQLFGHVKGAYTDAFDDQEGLLVQANRGTLFLDNISEMPLSVQIKLLRVLEDGEVRPLGSQDAIKVKFRLIASTQHNLKERCKQGTFREDLYFRMNVLTLRVPPLRERREDISMLIDHFIEEDSTEFDRPQISFSKPALKALMRAPWPGNVRQLKSTIQLLSALSEKKNIRLEDLPPEICQPPLDETPCTLEEAKINFFKDYLKKVLKLSQGDGEKITAITGMRAKNIYFFLNKYLPGWKENKLEVP